MNENRQVYKRNSKLILTISLCVVLALCCIALYFNIEKQTSNEVQAANTLNWISGAVGKYDTGKGNTSSTTVSPNSIARSSMTSTSGHISVSISSITTTSNYHFESGYIDFSSSIVVPAGHEYKVTYNFSCSIWRSNSAATNGVGCEIFDFNSDTITGQSANISINTAGGASAYAKRTLYINKSTTSSGSYTVTYTYRNESNEDKTYKQNFGFQAYCRATTADNAYISSSLSKSYSVEDTQFAVQRPTADSKTYTYTGNPQTYTPTSWVADDTELAADSDSMTQTDAGTYTIKILPKDYPWTGDDNSIDPITFTFTINKASPNAQPQYEQKPKWFLSDGLPTLTNIAGGVEGTFSWGTQTASTSQNEYTWTFTPDDTSNYETQTGTLTFNFELPKINDIASVAINDGETIYSAFDLEELKNHITVKALYDDGDEKIVSNSDYYINTSDGKLSAGNTEITVYVWDGTYDDDGEKSYMKKKVTIPVTLAEIISLDASYKSSVKFTYPITADEILAKLDVESDWNYTNKPVKITNKSVLELESNDAIAAGSFTFKVKYKGTDVTSVNITITIQKGTYDMSGVSFEDDSFKYDGNTHSLAITGTLPDGVTVSYEGNGETDFGEYTVTAKFTGDADNYEPIANMTAKLKIEKGDYVLEGITFEGANYPYDGETHSLSISGDLPDWISVDYFNADDSKFEGATEIGSYTITAKFTHSNNNYNEIEPMTATLVIGQSGYNVEFEFNDKSVVFNGQVQTIGLTGEVPDWLTVEYVDEEGEPFSGATNVGTYTITAKFTHSNELYEPIDDMTATLTITQAELEIIQGAKDFTYDGSVKGGTFTVKNYDADKIVKTYYKGNEINEANKLKDNELPKNAGEYTVVLSVAEEDIENCLIKEEQRQFKITIAKAQITAIWNSDSEIPVLKGLSEEEMDVVEYVFTDDEGITYKQSELQAGKTYKVKAVIADGYENNYEFIDKKGEVLDEPTMTEEQPFRTKDEVVEPEPATGFDFSKIIEMLKQYWQPIVCAICLILIIIFMSKGIGYAGKRKKVKKTIEKKYSTAYYAVGGVGLFNLPYATWTLIACIVAGVTVLSFIFMLLEKRSLSKAEDELDEAKEEFERNKDENKDRHRDDQLQMMLMSMLGGNANGQNGGGQSFIYQQPSLGADEIRGIVADTMSNMLPNVTQYLPQQASYNDELVQQLAEQNAQNEERIKQLAESNERAIEKLVEKLSSQQATAREAELQVASANANDEVIKNLIEGQKAIMEKLSRQDEDKQSVKVVEKDGKDERIEMLMRNQERLMEKVIELSARNADKPTERLMEKVIEMSAKNDNNSTERLMEKMIELSVKADNRHSERIVEKPVEKIVEKEVRVEVPVEKIVEVEKVVPMPVEKPAKATKAPAQRLTLDEAYAKLSANQKKIFDTLKAYALTKDKCKEKKSTYFIVLGQSTVNPLVKLTIKKNTTVAMFKMEDEYFKDIRRNATSDGSKIKVKESELVVSDNQALSTAKEMIDLREDQIERYNEYLKEQKSMRKK